MKSAQFLQPLFEYSGACAGCGETPYIKLLTQLFGDRTMIANATGCSSIYGANLPTTPYAVNKDGRGPTWSNSLFEDNAEFGLGMRLGVDHHLLTAQTLLRHLAADAGQQLVDEILAADQSGEAGIAAQRARVGSSRSASERVRRSRRNVSFPIADYLVKKSVWIVGGNGWAYDIGFGGLDHVLAVGRDVNILVLDTEVYSNTGGQSSKSTPLGASAKFATAGKAVSKKDLGLMAMGYGWSTSPGSPSARKTPRPSRPSRRPSPTPGPRSSSRTARASRTATTWPSSSTSRRGRRSPATGRSTASTRAARRRGRPRS